MYIIKLTPEESGARPPIQTWDDQLPPEGFAILPDNVDLAVFRKHNGFVVLDTAEVEIAVDEEATETATVVVGMTGNVEAWEAWKASLPAKEEKVPAPTTQERLNALEESNAELSEALAMLLEGVTE